MAEVLSAFDFNTRRTTSRYPWDKWLDGRVWRLTSGEDYVINTDSMRVAIYVAAKRRGLTVQVQTEDQDHLVLKASDPQADVD